jgi:hypothetical protein
MWKEYWLDLYQFLPAPLDGLATHAKPSSVGSENKLVQRASPTNCDDPVHGSGPGEIVFRHMSVVQRGVRSRDTAAGNRLIRRSGLRQQSVKTFTHGLAFLRRVARDYDANVARLQTRRN